MILPGARSLLARIQWEDERIFVLDGVVFVFDTGGRAEREQSTSNRFVLVKNRRYLNAYADHIDLMRVRRVLELGVFQGGSTALFDLLLSPEKMVAIERDRRPIEPLEEYRQTRGRSEQLKVYYGVDQADVATLEHIVSEQFDAPLDLVVDDASHFYDQTKASFSVLFPRLAPGGSYVIEDWGWAHGARAQSPDDPRRDRPALSTFLFELMMVAASSGSIIDTIIANNALAVIRKGSGHVASPFDVDTAYRSRGKRLNQL